MKIREEQIKSAVIEAVSRTLEDMAFEQIELVTDGAKINGYENPEAHQVIGEESPKPPNGSSEEAENLHGDEKLWAILPLINPIRGEISIEVTKEYALVLNEALFGREEENPTDEIVHDALAEVLNAMAGCFMNELILPDMEYEIGFPTTSSGQSSTSEKEAITLYFDLSGYIMKVMITCRNIPVDREVLRNQKEVIQ